MQRVDPTVTTTSCVYFTGITQATDTPQTVPHPWNYVFAPQQASPYVVTIAQQLNGSHTLFYNQAGDSSGSILASSLQSVRRTAAAARHVDETQRGIQRFSGTGVATGEVLVRFRGAPLDQRFREPGLQHMRESEEQPEQHREHAQVEQLVNKPANHLQSLVRRQL